MIIPLLYVTSFNEALYKVTGNRLIKSVIRHKISDKFLITYDGFQPPALDNFLYYDLEKDFFLQEWLQKYKQYIPKQYGGTAPECKCVLNSNNDKWFGHIPGCTHSEWNKRASKWFRKIAALNYALNISTIKPEKIVFLDSDVYFTKNLPLRAVNAIFQKNGLIYHLGKWRKGKRTGIESGIIGFAKEGGGFDYLQSVIDCFVSGEFLQYARWDDGFIFKCVLNKGDKKLKSKDLVTLDKRSSHVVNLGVLRNFFVHDKGHHLRKYKIV